MSEIDVYMTAFRKLGPRFKKFVEDLAKKVYPDAKTIKLRISRDAHELEGYFGDNSGRFKNGWRDLDDFLNSKMLEMELAKELAKIRKAEKAAKEAEKKKEK